MPQHELPSSTPFKGKANTISSSPFKGKANTISSSLFKGEANTISSSPFKGEARRGMGRVSIQAYPARALSARGAA